MGAPGFYFYKCGKNYKKYFAFNQVSIYARSQIDSHNSQDFFTQYSHTRDSQNLNPGHLSISLPTISPIKHTRRLVSKSTLLLNEGYSTYLSPQISSNENIFQPNSYRFYLCPRLLRNFQNPLVQIELRSENLTHFVISKRS